MKIMTILGTRPEIIRLSLVINKLDQLCSHVLVHTGQNYDPNLNEVFFEQMNVRRPDHFMGVKAHGIGDQIGRILAATEALLIQEKPDRLLLLGDTNSALSAIIAKRMAIPVYHMEAGNRCYDDRVPEEVNRRIIDHSSDILMPYTERSRANLLREGIPGHRIFVTGNPIREVLSHHQESISKSKILDDLKLAPKGYFLVTMHRAENVDEESRLRKLTSALDAIQRKYAKPVIISTHPRTRSKMDSFGLANTNSDLRFLPPFPLFEFVALEQNAFCVLSDSGTVQEECAIFGIPNVTIRDVTERPETIECGSNILSGAEPEAILRAVQTVVTLKSQWKAPAEYMMENVCDTVVRIVLAYSHQPK